MAILTPLERKLLENPDPFWKPDLEVLYLKMLHEHNMAPTTTTELETTTKSSYSLETIETTTTDLSTLSAVWTSTFENIQ